MEEQVRNRWKFICVFVEAAQAICELADADSRILRERTKSKEHLVLLQLESSLFGCGLASLQELPDAVPEFR
jgi:hypothetical protein